jgi:hypothetical protein
MFEPIDGEAALSKIDSLLINLYKLSRKEAVKIISEIVPEYISSNVRYNGKVIKYDQPVAVTDPNKTRLVTSFESVLN